MISSGLFNYINVLDKAADAYYLKQQSISNNIANQSTPGFKREDVNFDSVLERELRESQYSTLDDKVKNINLGNLDVNKYEDSPNFSYRLDENNVDPELEYVTLAETQIKYNALIDRIGAKFTGIKSVIK
jgi:flagellar basal-body rod protein FlgB